jgi:hypothetical protein
MEKSVRKPHTPEREEDQAKRNKEVEEEEEQAKR